jgi:hypothetical protein
VDAASVGFPYLPSASSGVAPLPSGGPTIGTLPRGLSRVNRTVAVEGSGGGALVADAVEEVDAGEHAATSATTTTPASATRVRLMRTSPTTP